ncbi:hypothetical protein ACFFRR_007374 [Megaselia abdita]
MLNLLITLLAFFAVVIECGVFDIKNLKNTGECRDFNRTLHRNVDRVLSSIDETPRRQRRSKRDVNDSGEFYNYRIRPDNKTDYIFEINIRVPDSINFPYESKTTPFEFFLPLFKTELVAFLEYDEIFMVTEGERCQYRCSKENKRCRVLRCWDRPSACFGDFEKCLEYDSEGECKNMANSQPKPNKQNEEYYDISSADFRRILRIGNERYFINNLGGAEFNPEAIHIWKCILEEKYRVYCFISSSLAGWNLKTLKTLSGH